MRRRVILAALAVVVGLPGTGVKPAAAQISESCNLLCLSAQAREALNTGRYADYLRLARQVANRAPRHPGGIYAVARGHALLGHQDSAIASLSLLADIGGAQDIESDAAFASLRTLPAFVALRERFSQNGSSIVTGKTAFSVPDPDFLPEALTWDGARDRWLIGSLAKRKVSLRGAGGMWSDFIAGRGDVLRVVGIHADSVRSLLWFATWEPAGQPTTQSARTRLFKTDLVTGTVLRTYQPATGATSHLLNDLAVASNGDVYVTDTHGGWIYRVTAAGDSLEVFLRTDPTRFSGANGITMTGDEQTLYVAFIEGVARIDIPGRNISYVWSPPGVSTAGIDGLYWYRGDLIAVQNARGLERVIRLELDDLGERITGVEVIERSRDVLQVPTTGAILGSQFFYIANSQVDRLGNDNALRPVSIAPAPLTMVRVVELTPSGK